MSPARESKSGELEKINRRMTAFDKSVIDGRRLTLGWL